MQHLISRFILPLPIFWILVILAFILFRKGKTKAARITSYTALFWLLLISTPFVPNILVKNLENQYDVVSPQTLTQSQKPVHILVLGAGHSNNDNLPATTRLSHEALAKITEGIRLHNQLSGSTIITSGFKGRGNAAQATVSAEAAVLLGVDAANIKLQTNPENTLQEAMEYKRVYGDTTRLIVVTTAIHMSRTLFLFHKAGLQPLPTPTGYMIGKRNKKDYWFWMPQSGNIKKMEAAIHEYVGLLWYKVVGDNS